MWDVFKNWIFDVIQFFYDFIGDWGVAILIITLIFRLIISPLMQKQTKSSFQMQKIQPQLQELQKRYSDDPQRLQQKMQELYAEAKFNPLSGCLIMILQMPIFMALYQVLNEIETRGHSESYQFLNLVPDLIMRPSEAYAAGMVTFIPYLVLLIIFAGATFLPMVLMQLSQKDNPQKNQTLILSVVMSLFMLFIGWNAPAGVLLYWDTSSIFGVSQQQITMRYMKKKEAEREEHEVKPVVVDVERKAKKPRPTKKR